MADAILKRDDINSRGASRYTQWKERLRNLRSGNLMSRNKKALLTIISHTASLSLI